MIRTPTERTPNSKKRPCGTTILLVLAAPIVHCRSWTLAAAGSKKIQGLSIPASIAPLSTSRPLFEVRRYLRIELTTSS